MTPQERQLVDDLFDRLARLETTPRDPAAERTIADGLARAPHAIYPLVQTVLLQDEALKRADARIRELAGGETGKPASGGFLDNMRQALTGRASVPSVHPNTSTEADLRWNRGSTLGASAAPAPGGSWPPPTTPRGRGACTSPSLPSRSPHARSPPSGSFGGRRGRPVPGVTT